MKTIIFAALFPFFSKEAIIDFKHLQPSFNFPQTFSTHSFNTATQASNTDHFNSGNFQFNIGSEYSNGNIYYENNDIKSQIRSGGSHSGTTSFGNSIISTGSQQSSSGTINSHSSTKSSGSQHSILNNFNPGNVQVSIGNAYAYGKIYYGNNDITSQIRNGGISSRMTSFENSITSTGSQQWKIGNLNTGNFQMGSERFSSENSIRNSEKFEFNPGLPLTQP